MSIEYFGEKLQAARKNKRWTQVELAKRLNLSNGTISAYETGTKYPTLEGMVKICELLDLSSDFLLGLSDNKLQQNLAELPSQSRQLAIQLIEQLSVRAGNYTEIPHQDKKRIE
ncbi:MAG: helix-turn-helix domain-containing protein [Streptococcaceae bacterium]|jgi:transcriptional regulator with XRE-family HTH domain|nr:helix-turn-helix domain-containing protein [Streptococcaceae bacterium]